VGVHDVAPQMLWARYFIEAQGYKFKESILNQDNMSAMLLEINGKESISKRTKHQHEVFLSKTELVPVKLRSSTAQQMKCWLATSPNQYKVANSVNYEARSKEYRKT
jgi:hypothetical protein